MKNQYFGDINDYKKYGLLRALSNGGAIRTMVCWMLTPDDDRTDGGLTHYLADPDRWRRFDPPLFDALAACLDAPGGRDVRSAARKSLIRAAVYFRDTVPDDPTGRFHTFQDFQRVLKTMKRPGLVFFDPDNGLEVRSVPYGKRGSCKYLYWHELSETFTAGHSVLIYQHFPRVPRDPFTCALANELSARTGAPEILSFRTSRVLFLLAPQAGHREYFCRRSREVARVWGPHIHADRHVFARK